MATITASAGAVPRRHPVQRHVAQWGFAWLLTAVLAFFILYPLVMLLWASLHGDPTAWVSLASYQKVFSSPETYQLVWTTLWLAIVRTAIGAAIGIFLAWVVTRTDTPWRSGIEVLVWIGFFTPPLPILVSWVLLAGRVGILNNLLGMLPFVNGPVFDVYSYAGIIWASSLREAALIFLLTAPAFRAMDASLEEAARMCGAGRLRALLSVTLPAVMPALLGATFYGFILAVESFEPEVFLGTPARIYVLSTRIYMYAEEFPQDMASATALSTLILLIVTGLILLQMWLLAGRSFVTVTGRGFSAQVGRLGRWRWLTFGLCLLYFFLSTVLPLSVLVAGSFMRGWGIWSRQGITLDHWKSFLADPRLTGAITNTVIMGLTVGLVGTLICALVGYLLIRTHFAGRPLLEFITWAPRTAPAVVLAIAYTWAFVGGTPILHPILGTIWILAIVLIVNGIPLGSRAVNGALHQISAEIEHAARVSGAGWLTTARHVLVPLLMPALTTSFVLLFLLAIRNLVLVVFFYTPDSRVLSTVLWESWTGRALERGLVAGVIMMGISSIALAAGLILRRRTGAAGF
jgi:iron(III) transport system permease protein